MRSKTISTSSSAPAEPTRFPSTRTAVIFASLATPLVARLKTEGLTYCLAADQGSEMLDLVMRANAPGLVYAWGAEQPLLENRNKISDLDTAYVCRGFVCDAPITDLSLLKKSLGTQA